MYAAAVVGYYDLPASIIFWALSIPRLTSASRFLVHQAVILVGLQPFCDNFRYVHFFISFVIVDAGRI
jgi:hypothetical protein